MYKAYSGGINNSFPCFAFPFIKRGDFYLAQVAAILQFLGKKYGYYPENEEDEARKNYLYF